MLSATSTGAAQICGGDGAGVGDGDAVGDGDWLAGVLAGCVRAPRAAAFPLDGVAAGVRVAGGVVRVADVVRVAVGACDSTAAGASRWHAAMTTVLPARAALPPTPLTSAK
jgi:hypothetical protein